MDSSSPGPNSASLPAFSSAIFSFHCTKDKPRINAHVSVLFLEEDPTDSDNFSGKGKKQDDKPESKQAMAGKEDEKAPGIPQHGEASSSKKDDAKWEDFGDKGWGAIIEEILEEEIPEELR